MDEYDCLKNDNSINIKCRLVKFVPFANNEDIIKVSDCLRQSSFLVFENANRLVNK